MPPKLRGQPEEGSEQEVGQGATEGSATAEITSSGGDGAITSLARMFESFMRYQRERDERQEIERRCIGNIITKSYSIRSTRYSWILNTPGQGLLVQVNQLE